MGNMRGTNTDLTFAGVGAALAIVTIYLFEVFTVAKIPSEVVVATTTLVTFGTQQAFKALKLGSYSEVHNDHS